MTEKLPELLTKETIVSDTAWINFPTTNKSILTAFKKLEKQDKNDVKKVIFKSVMVHVRRISMIHMLV